VNGILNTVERSDKRADRAAAAWRSQRQRLRLECWECEVICERVVSPWHCLQSGCAYVYAYEDSETTYFGCIQKVFAPELDLAAFSAVATRNEQGVVARIRQGSDPYGLLRATRTPLPHCRATIEQAYAPRPGRGGCCNPTFFHHPGAPHDDGIRMTTGSSPDRGPGSQD
jgi:hypothetical protein